MKAITKVMFLSLLLGLAFSSCKKAAKETAAKTGNAVKDIAKAAKGAKSFTLDNGTVHWAATKVGGGHNGTMKISSGQLSAAGSDLKSGKFTIDVGSLTVTDLKAGEGKEKLEGHLKTGDFFEVAKYSTGSFDITSVTPLSGNTNANCTITGNLTLKGITKSVTIPANVLVSGNKLSAIAPKFTINRTQWGINYKSGILGTVADEIISDDVTMSLEIAATAK